MKILYSAENVTCDYAAWCDYVTIRELLELTGCTEVNLFFLFYEI